MVNRDLDMNFMFVSMNTDLSAMGKVNEVVNIWNYRQQKLKAAGRTSILSRIWEHVLTYVTNLDFNTLYKIVTAEEYLYQKIRERPVFAEEYLYQKIRERPVFVKCVNNVLPSHQTLVWDQFRIFCNLNDSPQEELNKWLQYTFDRRVQRLEVNLSHHGPVYFPSTENYVLSSALSEHKSLNSPKEFILICILVFGGTLESLGVHYSGYLTFEVCSRPSLASQHLEINFCRLNTLVISDVNLIPHKIGVPRALLLKNVPLLVHIDILFNGYRTVEDVLRLACSFSKLRVVSLCLDPKQAREVTYCPCTTNQHVHEDRISQLPNEMLCCILSFLTLREAGRTSILSKRWKSVWTYMDDLDFNAFSTLCEKKTLEEYKAQIMEGRPKFVNLVNKVLQSHQTLVLNKFRIQCALNNSYQAELNKWIQYAFDKRVQRLEVNLSNISLIGTYVFPSALLEQRVWNSLKELSLIRVSVSGGTLEFLLHNCKHLEHLAVHYSRDLITLEVCGPSLALQHLEITFCPLKSLSVSNVNLISLKLGRPGALVIKKLPQLIHIGILSYAYCVEHVSRWLSCCFSKLEDLFLILSPSQAREFDRKLPQLPALKQLSLRLALPGKEEESMTGLSSFFRASPNLEKFSVLLMYPYEITTLIKEKNAANYPVPHLRVVEICQYRGGSIEMELVKYFLDNAISLEKIIVDPHYRKLSYGSFEEHELMYPEVRCLRAEIANEGRRCAEQQLLGIIPSHVKLQIL